jgi:macrolide-specific efflux system membrane fusion protein
MAVTANIIVKVKENVLLVPSSAVSQVNGQTVVKMLENGTLKEINIETGDSSDSQTEVISGITEGQDVVTSSSASSQGQSSQTRSVFSSFGGGGGAVRVIR